MNRNIIIFTVVCSLGVLMAHLQGCTSANKQHKVQSNAVISSFEKISSNISGSGSSIEITFEKGRYHNHPTFAIWLEDTTGKYLQSLFVTRAIGQGIFTYGEKSGDKWKPGQVRRPAALPYWSFKRGVKEADGLYIPTADHPVPDAYSGATPKGSFVLQAASDQKISGRVNLLLEVNQPWDWNEFWTNNKFPDDKEYMTSCQPSLVYSAIIDIREPGNSIQLKPIGHGHYSGKDGLLYRDLSTITTALKIINRIEARIVKP